MASQYVADMTIPCLTRIFAQHSRTYYSLVKIGSSFSLTGNTDKYWGYLFFGNPDKYNLLHPPFPNRKGVAILCPNRIWTAKAPAESHPLHVNDATSFMNPHGKRYLNSQGKTKRPVLPVCPGPSPRQTNLNIIVIGDNHQNIPPKERKTITMRCSMMRFSRWRPWIKHPPLSGTSHQTWKKSAILLGKSTILKQTHIWYCWLHVPVSC